MQGNRDGSWSVNSVSGRGNGVPVPGGYLPQANPLLSNFNLQQQINNYPLTQFPANYYSFGNANLQTQQNLIFNHAQIPHRFGGSGANVFLQSHNQSFLSFPPKPDISSSQNRGAFEGSSLKRRRQDVSKQGSYVVAQEILKIGESANSFSLSLPIPTDDESRGSRDYGGKGSLEKSFAKPKRKVEAAARIDKIVNNMRKSVIAAGESVSSTRVSQSVLEELKADSWCSLGVQMTDVPSLRQLMALEGKINAFIHCYVGARRIVTLHDLEVAICQNEFIDSFDDLDLGPLLQHPLVSLYFPSISTSTGPVHITSEEIISFLDSYLYTYHTDNDVKLDEFLNFVADKKSVSSKEKLGVRIQSLRMYVSFILDAKRQEGETLKVLLTELHQKYQIPSSKKQQAKSLTVSERADSFALHQKNYCGKHIRFDSSSSDENESVDFEVENLDTSDNISSCPYPSVAEEMKRLGGSNKKRKAKRGSSKLNKGHFKQGIPKSADDPDAKQVFSVNEADFILSEGALRDFISIWKDTCKEASVSVFVEKMLSRYDFGGIEVRAQKKRAKAMSSFPFVGLLNVAVTLVRRGMWDSIFDHLQATSQSDMTNLGSGNQVDDIKASENSELNKTQHGVAPKHSSSLQANTPNTLHMKSGSSSGNQPTFHLNSKLVHEFNNSFSADFSERDQLHTGTPDAAQAQQTGREGEKIAYKYFVAKCGKEGLVRWVNEHSETGLPYDLMIENQRGKKEYVEVKATVCARKDFFHLSVREWQFANEKGDDYIIAHVWLGNSKASLTQHRNPVKLCQKGLLQLLMRMPNQRNEVIVAF